MLRYLVLPLVVTACGTSAAEDCPPGASIDDWQVISDQHSSPEFVCPRQLVARIAPYGSVWISMPGQRHDLGVATLSALVRSDCPTGFDVRMSVSVTTRSVTAENGFYRLSAAVIDPWMVALGVLSQGACTATISSVAIGKQDSL